MGHKFLTVRLLCVSYEYENLELSFMKLARGFLMFSKHCW